jgi:hypothetical protein
VNVGQADSIPKAHGSILGRYQWQRAATVTSAAELGRAEPCSREDGRLAVLINNAGEAPGASFADQGADPAKTGHVNEYRDAQLRTLPFIELCLSTFPSNQYRHKV